MSDKAKDTLCLYVAMTFLLTGVAGVGMAGYMLYSDDSTSSLLIGG